MTILDLIYIVHTSEVSIHVGKIALSFCVHTCVFGGEKDKQKDGDREIVYMRERERERHSRKVGEVAGRATTERKTWKNLFADI